MVLVNKNTIGEHADMLFAVYPKRSGRQLEIVSENDWSRLGSLIARVHLPVQNSANHRITVHPLLSTLRDDNYSVHIGHTRTFP